MRAAVFMPTPIRMGFNWERPGSIELIYPDGTKGFQVNAGIRIRGGYSRSTGNPKHAFRFFFREEYGDAKLSIRCSATTARTRLIPSTCAPFRTIPGALKETAAGSLSGTNSPATPSWPWATLENEGEYYHLYINGQYWGLFNTDERPEASYGATYFGGSPADYDTIKVAPDTGYTIYATDGDLGAWTRLWNAAKAGLASDAAYQKIQGNNPDGTPNSYTKCCSTSIT